MSKSHQIIMVSSQKMRFFVHKSPPDKKMDKKMSIFQNLKKLLEHFFDFFWPKSPKFSSIAKEKKSKDFTHPLKERKVFHGSFFDIFKYSLALNRGIIHHRVVTKNDVVIYGSFFDILKYHFELNMCSDIHPVIHV